jgi:hypothetical protein
MKNANKELSKSGAPLVARNYLPEFESEVFLTFGTDYLCRITLEVHAGRYRISAVLSGPPNGYEISRKDYPCNLDASALEMHQPVGQGQQTIGIHPDQIAVDIISGILRGGFD